MAEPSAAPAAPAQAEAVADWSVFDQSRADQLRNGLAELARRLPRGESLGMQIWRLPASTTWGQVRTHYARQGDWTIEPDLQTNAGALVPDAQVLLDRTRTTRLDVALFRARPDVASDSAVLVVQRSRR